MPNLIHSLDAVTLVLLLNIFFESELKTKNVYTVHDCIGMTINNVDYIIDLLKFVYGKLYFQEQYLKKLDKAIILYIKNTLGESSFDDKTRKILFDKKELNYPDINSVFIYTVDISDLEERLKKASYLLV